MVIDSHMHLTRKANYDIERNTTMGMTIPEDTDLEDLISWWKAAGIEKAVCMGQDMTKTWNTEFGEQYVRECYKKHPEFFIPFAAIEPIDRAGRFNQEKYEYMVESVDGFGVKGLLFTPPFGQYYANSNLIYPFYEFAQKRNVVVQYHHSAQIGPAILSPHKYVQMVNLNDVIIDFPNLKIVVEHIGYPWSEQLFVLMTNQKNMYCDLAMSFVRPTWLAWNMVVAKEYGVIDRVMFASDYVAHGYDLFSENPTEDLKRWIDYVRIDLNRICEKSGWPTFTVDEIDGILYKNAARLYSLEV